MDVREKLAELLDEAEEWADHKCDVLDCETCPADKMKGNCVQQLMVDRLIANGVTVQEWIPVTERLPDDSATVTLCTRSRIVGPGFYDKHTKTWVQYYSGCAIFVDVTHWMPLPQPPKGE